MDVFERKEMFHDHFFVLLETTQVWTVGRHRWRRWFEADFLDHGIYTVGARAFNNVSETSASVDVHVLQKIKAVQLKSYSGKVGLLC